MTAAAATARSADGRIRVLHVVATGAKRGGEIFASDLIRALDDDGVVQRVAVLRHAGELDVDFAAPVTRLLTHPPDARPFAFDVRIARELRRALALHRPDVLLAHGGEPLKYAIPARGRGATKVVYRRIGSIRGRTSLRGLRLAAYSALMRRASSVVAVADYVREETINRFRVPPRRVVTIPNAVDERRVHPVAGRREVRRSFGISAETPAVLSVGAFTWEKDPVGFVEVANAVVRARPEVRFLMVGDGPMRQKVETAIHDHGLERDVTLLGARDDIADLMAASDVLLLTSRTEGMPGSLIEAGMLGLPAVAPSVGGIPEVVEHGVTGLLVRPGDRATMAAAVMDLLGDDARRRAMGVASRERCTIGFEIRGVAHRYLEILEGACAGP